MRPFKIWCDTKEERENVLKEMDKRGVRWFYVGHRAAEFTPVLMGGDRVGLFVDENKKLTYTVQKPRFKERHADYKEYTPCEYCAERTPVDIYKVGRSVFAVNKKTGERAEAKCHPGDAFSFPTGAGLAVSRLFGNAKEEKSKYLNTKICITGFGDGTRYEVRDLTIGKIYTITDGLFKDDAGGTFPFDYRLRSIDDLKIYFRLVENYPTDFRGHYCQIKIHFVEVVE